MYEEVSLAADEDFKPTPIPLNEWNSSARGAGGAAGTLQDIIATDAPPHFAAVPAHYWEDALRHSVYLTLVRDKIDKLIAKGSIQPDSRPDQKDDDHDLWEKIKTASFDRLNTEEPAISGDVTIMSKGRLLEEKDRLRFTEDAISTEKCNEEKCNENVKAYWSVKRVRQRDVEMASGKYHYELTFSVSSQTPKKQKKPHENPVRTFTVREGTPVEKPQYRPREPPGHMPRPQRAVWFHKNIVPTPPRPSKQEQGLDRLFSSWFSDDEPPKRYKQMSYVPQMYPQHSKVGHVGAPTEQYHQKHGQAPYPYKSQQNIHPNSYKYSRPPLGPPVGPPQVSHPHTQHHYIDLDTIRHPTQFTPPPPPEIKYQSSNVVKTTKPAVLPTPPITYEPLNITMDLSQSFNINETTTTKDPEIITGFTMYSKPKPPPTKMSYFPEHVRPPVFNAPPGVFVTMDKKPFKPMPPLKYVHSYKQNKNKPVDFRPSPQVLDVQFSDPDPLSDSFRPIAMSYGSNATDSSEQADGERRKPIRKTKPPKKHDKIKSHRHTTSAPEIITAHNDVLDEMHWANILGAFVKTTPMVSQKLNVSETTTPLPSTTVSSTTVQSTPNITEATTTVSQKPRRTRPPPKFSIPEKVKKHKRVTSTTTTSTTTTTEKPHHRRPLQDLTPQATSASTGTTKSGWQTTSKNQNITVSTTPMSVKSVNDSNIATVSTLEPSTTMNIAPTTYRAVTTTRQKTTTTTTTQAPTTTTEKMTTVSTTPPKNNRFRQSTLIIKGTSVKHDKWSSPLLMEKNKTVERAKPVALISGKFPRRKGSNFQGYVASTPKLIDEERNREDHVDHVYNSKLNVISLSTEATTDAVTLSTTTTQATNEESAEEFEYPSVTEEPENDDDTEEQDTSNEGDVQESKDHNEFIFDTSSKPQNFRSGDKSNEIESEIEIFTEETIVTSHSVAKNKTKCKKKKNNQTPTFANESENEMSVAPIEITTEKLSTADFFNQIFGLTIDQNEANGNQTESKYVDNDEDLEEFLHSINDKKDSNETNEETEYEDDDKDETENSPFNNDEDNRFPRNAESSYEDYQDRSYSFLELMAMK